MQIREVVVSGPNQVAIEVRELDTRALAPQAVRIETEYTVISAGTELANYTGKEPQVHVKGSWCCYPWRSGYGNVGQVRAVGSAITHLKPGDRVLSFANHASQVIYDAAQQMVVTVPAGLDPRLAAASRMAGVAVTALLNSEIRGDPWVVVYGLGMVGNLAAQSYRLRGCRVIGIDPTASRRKIATACGIPYVLSSDGDPAAEIKAITGGEMGAIVVESVGHSAVVQQALKVTATRGQLLLLGTPRVPVQANLSEFLGEIHYRSIVLRSAFEWCLPTYSTDLTMVSHASKFQMLFNWILRGELKLEPLLSHCLPPEKIAEAYNGLRDQPDIYTGVILKWTD